MNRFEAIEIIRMKGYDASTRNAYLASRNMRYHVYWSNAPIKCLNMNWYLMLNDDLNQKLYLLYIPENSIQENELSTKTTEPHKLHIEIKYDDPLFTDRRSPSKHFSFKKFLVDEFQY